MPRSHPERYDLLDAWRGLAALAVCVHHVCGIPIGHQAVMLFFVISGYCIAASADACRRKGWGFQQFMWRRIRRIYPPYFCSVGLWAATRLLKLFLLNRGLVDATNIKTDEMHRSWVQWLQQSTLTQWITLIPDPVSWPATNTTLFVAAYWSLCYEEQFYLIMGLMVLFAGVVRFGVLAQCLVILAIGLAWNVGHPCISYGWFLDYWSLFAVGVLVFYRLCRIESSLGRRVIDIGLTLTCAAAVYLGWLAGIQWTSPVPTDALRIFYWEYAVAAGFAILLIAMRPLSERIAALHFYQPLRALGAISFSLYLIHQINAPFLAGALAKLLHPITGLGIPSLEHPWPHGWREVMWALSLGCHIALAAIFWWVCERPFLNKPIGATRLG